MASGEGERGGEKDAAQRARFDLAGLDRCIETLGGRLTDLEFLSRRIKAGQPPQQAVDEIVDESATDVVKMFLLPKAGEAERKWSAEQAWHLVLSLAESPSLRYYQVLLSPAFASSAGAELISLGTRRGRPRRIRAGKPLYQAAFARLARDRVLRAKMDLAVLGETELALLGSLPRQTGETAGRVSYLLAKLDAAQRNITELEREMGTLKKVLNDEY